MSKAERKEFSEDFRKKLETDTTIEIKESVKNSFENGCLQKVNSYANNVHNWREKSLRSTTFVF